MYAGYMIPKPKIKNWFVELYYANPFAYASSRQCPDEFHGQYIDCVGGATTGVTSVTGDQYLGSLHYHAPQMWRKPGILWAWWGFFAILTIIYTCFWKGGEPPVNRLFSSPRESLENAKLTAMRKPRATKKALPYDRR
ncbi:ABC transporter [Penicillium atrosanguineum]|nr:ABC transporter [Penicillium atrosanguineum]